MRSMTTRTTHTEVLAATEHLPDGATLVIHGFDWDEYERLLEDLGHSSHLRLSYDSGSLRILSISAEHDEYATALEGLINEITVSPSEFRQDVLSGLSASLLKCFSHVNPDINTGHRDSINHGASEQ